MELLDPPTLAFRRIEKYRQALVQAYDNVERRTAWQAKLNEAEEHFRMLSEVFLRVEAKRPVGSWRNNPAA
jgi:hypothetical protein